MHSQIKKKLKLKSLKKKTNKAKAELTNKSNFGVNVRAIVIRTCGIIHSPHKKNLTRVLYFKCPASEAFLNIFFSERVMAAFLLSLSAQNRGLLTYFRGNKENQRCRENKGQFLKDSKTLRHTGKNPNTQTYSYFLLQRLLEQKYMIGQFSCAGTWVCTWNKNTGWRHSVRKERVLNVLYGRFLVIAVFSEALWVHGVWEITSAESSTQSPGF